MKNPFKIKKFKDSDRKVCAIYNKFFRVVKNSKGIYFYELVDFSSLEYRRFYKGKKTKFINKYVIYLVTFLFNLIVVPLLILLYYPFSYFDGCKNFIKNGVWCKNVRLFNYINFILLVLFILYYLIS